MKRKQKGVKGLKELVLTSDSNPVNRVQNGKDANFLVVFGVTAPNEIFEGNQDGPV